MEIVIKIDEYDKEWIHNAYDIPNEIKSKVVDAIENGTPLPKGHGRLIDADSIISEINKRIEKCREEHGCYGNSYDARCFNLYNIVIDIINNAQTANIERGDEDV